MCVERPPGQGGGRLSSSERSRRALLHLFAGATRPFLGQAGRPNSAPIQRVLLIRPDHLGDVLFATPALERWRRLLPADFQTTLSVGPWAAELAAHIPLAGVLDTFPYPGFTRQAKGSLWAPYSALWCQARVLRRQRFDLAVILRFDHWWGGLLAYLAGIPLRLGYATDPLAPFLNLRVPYSGVEHEVERNLALIDLALAACGVDGSTDGQFPALVYNVTLQDRRVADAILAGLDGPGAGPLVTMHVGAGAPVKQWPAERFAAVADRLVAETGATILLTGGQDELSLAWKVAAYMHEDAHVLAGRTTLGQLAAVLERSALVVGADSGPLHLAVALRRPSLHLFGPADPRLFGPWSDAPAQHRVIRADCPCAPCNRLDYPASELEAHRCMERIGVAQVLAAARALLAGQTA